MVCGVGCLVCGVVSVVCSVDRVALFIICEYYYECIIINRLLLRFSNFSNNRK